MFKRSVFTLVCCIILTTTVCTEGFCSDKTAGFILGDSNGRVLYSQNKETYFTPASILKILTSLVVIHHFGRNHRFETHYYFNPVSNDLYIRGFGDPLFISETIYSLVRNIKSQIKTRYIRHIICDTSFFSQNIIIPGKGVSLNPYDSSVGALCANFNTINFIWDNTGNRFVSAEPQTPLLDIFQDKIKKSGLKKGRIVLSGGESRIYASLLIRHFLEDIGLKVTGDVREGTMPQTKQGNHVFHSPYAITEVVSKLLKFSNNFMANQLLLSMGAFVYGPPATLEKGILAVQEYSLKNLGLTKLQIIEGSGISRQNKLTPVQMITVLNHFAPYYRLMKQNQNDFYKTGTLYGVRTRAGFIMGADKRLYPYVIMINKKNTGYGAILKALKKKVAQSGTNN